MSAAHKIPVWKAAPFIRLLLPFIAGTILQWYLQPPLYFILTSFLTFCIAFLFFYRLPLELRYKYAWLQGVFLNLFILSCALIITWKQDIRHTKNWFGHFYNDKAVLVVKINEPLIEKTNSYKADGIVENIISDGTTYNTTGKLLLYFKKSDTSKSLKYGNKILVNANLQKIKNSGNPGAFNYERYAAFQQLFYNVYLKNTDFVSLKQSNTNWFYSFVFSTQAYILNAVKTYLPDDKNVVGIAEALLIGYKEDLDKDLVQAYSNTGVVHVIAISGLHLGLIYVMLLWVFSRLPVIKRSKITRVILILGCLWLFAILTGASASVLRSAVMFTCILLGKNFFKQASVYNSLAASAFLLLCYNPYFLWDVGFQLSYFAVFGIVWLQQPIYRFFYVKNKWLNKIWEMMSVTLAAQVLTFPICIYYFHQFPNMFILTNLLVVPLSTLTLFAEIFLVVTSGIPIVPVYIGKIIYWLVWLMNYITVTCNNLYFSVIDKMYATALSTWLLYGMVMGFCGWLLYKNKILFKLSLVSVLLFTLIHSYAKYRLLHQQKIVIYNVPQHKAVDFIYQNNYYFVGDSIMKVDGVLQNFHIKPARVLFQVDAVDTLPQLFHQDMYWQYGNKKCLFIDTTIKFHPLTQKIKVDVLLVSKNPAIKMVDILAAVAPSIIVFDASNSLWKIENWKKECEQLLLRCHSVSEQGAFVLNAE